MAEIENATINRQSNIGQGDKMIMYCLRGLNKFNRFSTIFTRETTFVVFAFLYKKPLLKIGLPYTERIFLHTR